MSAPPPSYPGDAKAQQAGYGPPPQVGYGPPPQQAGSGPPPPQQGYAQPPPPGYGQPGQPPVAAQPGTTTIVMAAPMFGESPVQMACPFCQAQIVTSIDFVNGGLTWLAIGGLFIVGCWLGCCLIPLCIDGCKDVVHTCPNCNRQVGRKSRL